MSGQQSPQEDFIREKLNSNLEAYSNNTVLNKLTPSRNRSVGRNGNSSSARRGRTSSNSGTPDWNRRYPRRNDSNIVTSPVKTMKNYNNDSIDNRSSNNNTQPSKTSSSQVRRITDNSGTSTTKLPLKSSPKKPLRKGTPLIKKKVQPDEKLDGSPKGRGNGISPKKTKQTSQLLSTNSNSSARKIATNSHINYSLATKDDGGIDNDEIEDDFLGSHHASNNTLLSEIPSDILSPEKHVYPAENLRKSSSNLPSAKKLPNPVIDLYPSMSPARANRKHSSPNKSPKRDTSFYQSSTHAEVGEYDEEEDDKPPANPISLSINSTLIQRSSPSHQTRESKLPIPIYSDHSSKSSSKPAANIFDGITLKNHHNKEETDQNENFRHLNEFIRNPLIDEDKYNSSSNHLGIEKERKAFELREQARRASRSPQNKPGASKKTNDHTTNDNNNTYNIANTKKRDNINTQKQLDLSRFESSDEEHEPPELTVPLTNEPLYKSSTKRKNDFIETSTIDKRSKKDSLYPILPYQSPTKANESKGQLELKTPLYPILPSLTTDLKQKEQEKQVESFKEKEKRKEKEERQDDSKSFSNVIDDISNNIVSEVSKPKVYRPEPLINSKIRQKQSRPVSDTQDKPPGGPNDWNRNQWKSFLTAFKFYKTRFNMDIFTPRLLDYLQCDKHEIQLKIQFFLNHEDEFKK